MKGRIAFFEGSRKFGIVEHDLPEPEEGALLVKVLCTNICGSDVKNWKGASSVGVGERPTCQGHEFVGEIYRLGKGVERNTSATPRTGPRAGSVALLRRDLRHPLLCLSQPEVLQGAGRRAQ